MSDCIFCKIIAGDIPSEKLYEDDEILVFRDIYPQAPVHFLVIPKKHIPRPVDVAEADDLLTGKMLRIGAKIAKENNVEDDYRVIFNNGSKAGQLIFHLHMHILGGKGEPWPM